jgi:hypothetical protein
VNLATRGGRLTPSIPSPAATPSAATSYCMDAAFMSFQHGAVWLSRSLAGRLGELWPHSWCPCAPQSTPVTADPRPLSRHAPFIRRGCLVHVAVTAWMWHSHH